MAAVVANLGPDDLLAASAYLASLGPSDTPRTTSIRRRDLNHEPNSAAHKRLLPALRAVKPGARYRMTAIARTTALPEATPVGALSAQLRRPRSRSAMSGVHQLRPAGIRERRPLADGMAKRSLAVRKLSRFAVGTSISGRPYREPQEFGIRCGYAHQWWRRRLSVGMFNWLLSDCGCPRMLYFLQTELRGFSKSVSANIATATAINSGRCSGSQKTVPPHSGQKLNVTVLPLSARRAYRLTRPLASRTCSRG